MYTGFPRRTRVLTRASLAVAWGLISCAGIGAVLNPDPRITEHLGVLVYPLGTLLIVSGIGAAIGAATERYRWEWVGAWMVAASVAPYAVAAWANAPVVSALLLSALVVLALSRALFCSGFAARLRAQHFSVKPPEPGGTDG